MIDVFEYPIGTRECPECDGYGELIEARGADGLIWTGRCERCEGTGQINDDEEEEEEG